MKISLLQFASRLGDIEQNESAMLSAMEFAVDRENAPDIVVLPELWNTGCFPKPISGHADKNGRRNRRLLSGLAKKYSVNIIGGSIALEKDGKIYNTSIAFDRQGNELASYSKIHLFSYSGEEKHFSSGGNTINFAIDEIKCSTIICYDLRFPELARKAALEGSRLLFIPAAWPLKRRSHWNALLKARAIENQFFVAGVNCFGDSSIIDPWGESIGISEKAGETSEIITAELDFGKVEEARKTINIFQDRRPDIYI